MSVYFDHKYLIELIPKLRNFKRVREDLYQFSCPICGDSKKDSLRARGYIYTFDGCEGYAYKCHNCGTSMSFANFLKLSDDNLYRKYVFDLLKNEKTQTTQPNDNLDLFRTKESVVSSTNEHLNRLQRVSALDDNHPAKVYVHNRKIPPLMVNNLFYCDDFQEWTNTIIPGKFPRVIKESRLIIPFFDRSGKMFMYQGRTLDPKNELRYVTIKLDDTAHKIFGLDRLKYNKEILVVEGPIDSMFLPNCLAVGGACYNDPLLLNYREQVIIVPDNERRNKEVCRSISTAIKNGYKVCLWRNGLEFKDINEAILRGYSSDDLVKIIHEDSYSGLKAEVKFNLWRKM